MWPKLRALQNCWVHIMPFTQVALTSEQIHKLLFLKKGFKDLENHSDMLIWCFLLMLIGELAHSFIFWVLKEQSRT